MRNGETVVGWGRESRDSKVRDKKEGAETYMGHFVVCAKPGDPMVTPTLHVLKASVGQVQEQG